MRSSTTLLMAIHCHQPVGNFGFVFEEAYANAYDPFLQVLERHPGVRLALHYSGCLLDWLLEHQPAFLGRLRALVSRGQVELLASGYYEPILPLIPEADRQGQIARMRAALRTHGRANAEGLWLTERVWEPDLPATLARAGIRYTMVDTNQFLPAKAWLPGALQVDDESFWDLLGCYVTEHVGRSVLLFPASKRLRYWLPFQPVDRTIEFLKRLKREEPAAITFADDGEKFGLWPSTHRWVYQEGWLDQFFTALEQERDWLTTTTFHEYVEETPPSGRVYLPSGSYEEMLEWSGGHFRNFFTKYPEANAMQQKMLRVSQRLAELKAEPLQASSSKLHATGSKPQAASRKPGARSMQPVAGSLQLEAGSRQPAAKRREALLQQARQELYTGQCNCAYWHGVFGGLYLSYLRRAVYAHLIAAEALTDQALGETVSVAALDADGDGCEETRLKTPAMGLIVDPEDGGTVTAWDLYGPRVNLLDTLSRRHESYHDKLKEQRLAAAVPAGGVPASIHDTLGVKEEHLATHVIYDDHQRTAFLDYALERMPTLQEVVSSAWGEQRLWSPGPFSVESTGRRTQPAQHIGVSLVRRVGNGFIRKTIQLMTRKPVLECGYELEGLEVPVVALEFNISLRDERYLKTAGQRTEVAQFDMEEPSSSVSLSLSIDPPATVLHFPIETVSESEQGLERTYQGLCITCCWTLQTPGRSASQGGTSPRWASRLRFEARG